MTYRFFGQFLLERGVISAEELAEALEYQSRNHAFFGEYALKLGYLTLDQLNELLLRQKRTTAKIGELAVQLGMLTHQQAKEILNRQKADHLYLGEVLVKLGVLDREELYPLLEEYHRSVPVLKGESWDHFPFPTLYEQLILMGNTYFERLLQEPVRVHPGTFNLSLQYEGLVSGVRFFHRDKPFRFFLHMNPKTLKEATKKYLKRDEEVEPEWLQSTQEELVNIISGNFLAYSQHLGQDWDLEPPITIKKTPLLPLYGSQLYEITSTTPHFQWSYILDIGENGGKNP